MYRMVVGGKDLCIFGHEIIEGHTIDQMCEAMKNSWVVQGALMPDAHLGYAMPIGGVIATRNIIVPAWVGHDIGCGMAAVMTTWKPQEIENNKNAIFEEIYKRVPVGFKHHSKAQTWRDMSSIEHTEWLHKTFYDTRGLKQLGTLGSGNHFIEIGVDHNNDVRIIVHSGSRNVGHRTATHYMQLASNSNKAKEGHYPLGVWTDDGINYYKDMNFCLKFALANRRRILGEVDDAIQAVVKNDLGYIRWESLINRNHNHVEYKPLLDTWIHRKGATHAEDGMLGVIPGNMRDGSYIVQGLGNSSALWSSSHGCGRAMSRKQAKAEIDLDDFALQMNGIKARITKGTLDEAPAAYKVPADVMSHQTSMVQVLTHVHPIINIKG